MAKQFAVVAVLLVVTVGAYFALFNDNTDADQQRLTVYVAHDRIYSEPVLKAFEERTGIILDVVYDTEATKSLGLIERIQAEKDNPQCDVFWNNEILGTMALADQGLLAQYKGSAWERIPDLYKAVDGTWVGFGSRMRVFILNTDRMPADADQKVLMANALEMFCYAKPMYGTTLTQMAIMWDKLGEEGFTKWYRSLVNRKAKMVDGNGVVKDMVANGALAYGWTDTDDAFLALDAKKPVRLEPLRLEEGKVIAIPNTAAIIKNAKHMDAAKQLIDFLASEQNELDLANGQARQIPLGDVDASKLSEEVRGLQQHVGEGYPLTEKLLDARKNVLAWFKKEIGS